MHIGFSNPPLQKDTEIQNSESTINPCEISSSISTLPNKEDILSMNVPEIYDALDDSDSNHSQDTEVDDSQHASIDQSIVSPYDINRAVQLKKTVCLTDIQLF